MTCKRTEFTIKDALELIPKRHLYAHKGCFGKDLLICGSVGYTGAAWFAAMGALRAGAGLVFLGVPESIYQIEAIKLNEAVVFPLHDEQGMLSSDSLDEILSRADKADAVLVGCGLGRSEDTSRVVERLLCHVTCPLVLDADGISMLSGKTELLKNRKYPTVLTPHEGEFLRLGYSLESGRIPAAEQSAKELGCIIVLKGHQSIITDGTETFLNTTGNPGMAVGGSGDILAGMITGLIGQKISPLIAAAAACCIHGAAGDLSASRLGHYSMLPTDLLDDIGIILKDC